ncbi:MAG TPA: hypothetical protein O0Y09_03055, partial [Methanocorpusculum sp.]|nr:hypothetical protein [Methanocorpusculum sp.]
TVLLSNSAGVEIHPAETAASTRTTLRTRHILKTAKHPRMDNEYSAFRMLKISSKKTAVVISLLPSPPG